MKQILLTTLCFVCISLSAAIRTAEQALQIANTRTSTMARHAANVSDPYQLIDTEFQDDEQTPTVYVLQKESHKGFMLVSAETQTQAIVAYSENGEWDIDHLPVNARYWLDRYTKQIAAIRQNPSRGLALGKIYPVIDPLIGTQWNQDTPFNDQCPAVGSDHAVTGCVATAAAQIMFYHKHPTTGTGSYSYIWNSQTLTANFGATTYDWANMLKKYTKSATQTQKNAIATLMSHVGISCDMQYGLWASSANADLMMAALTTYFGYDANIRPIYFDYWGAQATLDSIAKELQSSRPVFLTAQSQSGGHAFVGEGMDKDGKIYINWGWGGMSDGYYALTLLQPKDQGIGGGSDVFDEDIVVYTGIRPNAGGSASPQLAAVRADLTTDTVISKTANTGISFTNLSNIGTGTWNGGAIYVTVRNSNGKDIIQQKTNYSGLCIPPSQYMTTKIAFNITITQNLDPGEYTLVFDFTQGTGDTKSPLLLKGYGALTIPITVTTNQVHIHYKNLPFNYALQKSKMIQQKGTNNWTFEFTSDQFWSSSSVGNDILIQGLLNSRSGVSAIGSYKYSKSAKINYMDTISGTNLLLGVGYYQSYSPTTINDIEVTLSATPDKGLRIEYYIIANGSSIYTGTDTIANNNQNWWYKEGEYVYQLTNYTTDLVAPLTPVGANTLGATIDKNNQSHIAYLIKGVVSSVESNEGSTRSFTLATNSSGNDALKVTNCKWLNNQDWTASNQVYKDDQFTILAQLIKDASGNLHAEGLVYEYQSTHIGTSIPSTTDSSSINKVLMNGQLYILREGKTYNALGNMVP